MGITFLISPIQNGTKCNTVQMGEFTQLIYSPTSHVKSFPNDDDDGVINLSIVLCAYLKIIPAPSFYYTIYNCLYIVPP